MTLAPLACSALPIGPFATGKAAAASADAVIYSDGLATGWSNWSWNSTLNFNDSSAYSGASAIRWQIAGAWGGLYVHTDQAVQTGGATTLQFALRASQDNQRLQVAVVGANNQMLGSPQPLANVGGTPPANSWKLYTIPLSALNAAGAAISGVMIQDGGGSAQPAIEVDEVKLAGIDSGPGPGSGASSCGAIPAYPEIRPDNAQFNQTMGQPTDPSLFYGDARWRPYYDKITGACTGTTEQILEWAARKWGFDQLGYPDLAKAIGVVESWWRQTTAGAHGEVGILQVNPIWPDWQPARRSTAYAADYAMAVIRSYYDGNSWLGDQTKGNLRDAVGAWECGCAHNGGATYATRVFTYNDTKPWTHPGQPPDWF